MKLRDTDLVFSRPYSRSHPWLAFALDSIQCIKEVFEGATVHKLNKLSHRFFLRIISYENTIMLVYFESDVLLKNCYSHIKQRQGFDNLLDQYYMLGKLGNGSYGEVFQAKHKNILLDYAVKLVDKKKALKGPRAVKET